MGPRIVAAAIVGGIVVFCWGAASHMLLPLGEVGFRQLPNEAPLLAALREYVPESGLYMFPGMGQETPNMSNEQRKLLADQWAEKYREGPTGFLVYHATGTEVMPPSTRQLGVEFATDVAASAVAAWLLAVSAASVGGYVQRVAFVALLGVFAAVAVEVQYWNWYGFPSDYTIAAMTDQIIGSALSGLVIAAIVKPRIVSSGSPQPS